MKEELEELMKGRKMGAGKGGGGYDKTAKKKKRGAVQLSGRNGLLSLSAGLSNCSHSASSLKAMS